MTHHRPHSRNVPRREQHLLIVAAENLVAQVQQAGADIDPHEGEVPLQCATQPTADGERLGPVEQVFLRDLRSEAGKGAEDLQPASYHHEQRHRVNPMAKAHYQGMLVHRLSDLAGLRVFDCNRLSRHIVLPFTATVRRTPSNPDLPSSRLSRAHGSLSGRSDTWPVCSRSWWE